VLGGGLCGRYETCSTGAVDLCFSAADEAFRSEVREWLACHLIGEFAELRGRGGPGDEDLPLELRRGWERELAQAGFNCIGWPTEHGGRGLSLAQQMIFYEEYARAGGPGRLGHIGETLLAPTLMAFGTLAQKERFLPTIRNAEELWCQGYSEPNAGSDLANVQTRALRDGDEWVITGQKIWTSHAQISDWCFLLCRTNLEVPRHGGLSYLLVPMRQPGIEVRPIVQITGTAEFNEVFFDAARTAADNVVGAIDGGWKVAMGTLAFERGASTLGQQLAFEGELRAITAVARENGKLRDPVFRQRFARAYMELAIMRLNALRLLGGTVPGELPREALIMKLYWATLHRDLGALAMDVLGLEGQVLESAPYELGSMQRLFLFARADTIYAGSNEIQKNIIAERALGLPPEPRLERAPSRSPLENKPT
jgi:alkylation response protein AidB-like acyl-CoA dehydrogenase